MEAGDKLGVERWDLEQVAVIPNVPAGRLFLHLCSVGNPDHGPYAPVSEPEWHIVTSLVEAREKCCDYLEKYSGGIGGGNWGPPSGVVTNSQGAEIAKFSFNLRCFAPSETELTCLDAVTPTSSAKPIKYIVLSPNGVPIREKPFATKADAERGVLEFVARYRVQGYYAGEDFRLDLDEIAARCTVQKCRGDLGRE